MKRQKFFILVFLLLSACAIQKSSDIEKSVLFSIDGEPTIADEFIYVYEKNNFNNDSLYFEQDVDEYFDLFVNFKLKVKAAKSQGIDTTQTFLDEFKTYKDQLINPYLSETKAQEQLVEEAYERMKYEVDASHILITVDQNASPQDTLKAFQKISEVYDKAKSGEDFEELAVKYSEDPSAKTNKGRLGYFTAFQMVFAFEDAAYNTPIDSISDIIRSRFGYHILKVHGKRPFSGKVKVSHIMITDQNGTVDENSMKNKIFEIHDQVAGGANWNELCQKYSEDQRTKNNGGTLPFIGLRQINDEAFESVAFNLQNPGDISDPVRSRFGWHIIKLVEKQGLRPFEELKTELEQKVRGDERSRMSKKAVITRLKKQNNFRQNDETRRQLVDLADSALLEGKWTLTSPDSIYQMTLFSIANDNYDIGKTVAYIEKNHKRRPGLSPRQYMNDLIDQYIEHALMDFEEQQLIASNRDFRMLLNEYYEGILLFEIMNKNVWGKAVEDTLGLQAYFEKNQDNYMWDSRADAVIFESDDKNTIELLKGKLDENAYVLMDIEISPNEDLVSSAKVDTLVRLYQKYSPCKIVISTPDTAGDLLQFFDNNNIPEKDIIQTNSGEKDIISVKLNSISKKSLEYLYNKESALNLRVEESLFEKGDSQLVDTLSWEKGRREFEKKGTYYLVEIREILEPQPKVLNEIKGTVISDYQNYLEKTWIEELKGTYALDINYNTLDQIKSSFRKKRRSSD